MHAAVIVKVHISVNGFICLAKVANSVMANNSRSRRLWNDSMQAFMLGVWRRDSLVL